MIKVGFICENNINILQKDEFVNGLLRCLRRHERIRQSWVALRTIKNGLIECASISFDCCADHLHLQVELMLQLVHYEVSHKHRVTRHNQASRLWQGLMNVDSMTFAPFLGLLG